MIIWILATLALFFAAVPALLYRSNTRWYRPPELPQGPLPPVSVLIPARNEERSIAAAVESVLASEGVDLEVIVLDDHSTDATAAIVRDIQLRDPRVRLESAPELPSGWSGKQHACYSLAQLARHDVFVFLDADVRLSCDAIARMVDFLQQSKAPLVSGFPRQETVTPLEWLILPLIHFLLLGFLPIARMRRSTRPDFAAGCGQLFVAQRAAYEKVGGHSAVRTSFHDGITLPRAYRAAGFATDICDATDLATCRMYRSAGEVWNGLAKNAREGLGAPALLLPSTLMLFCGQVLPFVLLGYGLLETLEPGQWALVTLAAVLAWYPRWDAVFRFRQSLGGALLHPLGVLLLLAIQWYANVRAWLGKPVGWKGRPRPTSIDTSVEESSSRPTVSSGEVVK